MQSRILATNQSYIGFSTTGDGGANNPKTLKVNDAGTQNGNLQVSIVGTSASISVFGRANVSTPWQVLATVSVSGNTSIPMLPEMYAQVTAITAAVVNAAIAYPIAGA